MATAKKPRTLEYVDLDTLAAAPVNPKRHNLPTIRASMARFGIIDPQVEDGRTGKLVAGHGRMETLQEAKALGVDAPEGIMVTKDGRWMVPLVRGWASRDDSEAIAAGIAVNHGTEVGGWDMAELGAALDSLRQADDGLDGLGYEVGEVDAILADLAVPDFSPGDPDAQPRLDVRTPIVCPSCGHSFHRV